MGSKNNMYVTFKIEKEYYGIIIDNVIAIEKMQSRTRIPNSADYIDGVINLRGEVIALINLRKRLNMNPRDIDNDTRIIIINYNDIKAGLIVDSSSEVIEINDDKIDNPPVSDENEGLEYVKGIGKSDHGIITLLDLDRLFEQE